MFQELQFQIQKLEQPSGIPRIIRILSANKITHSFVTYMKSAPNLLIENDDEPI